MQDNTDSEEKDWFRDGICRAHYVRRAGMKLVAGLEQGVQEEQMRDENRAEFVGILVNMTKSVNDEYEEEMKKLEEEWHYTDQTFQQFADSITQTK